MERSRILRFLDRVEWLGNKVPDPVVLFLIGLILTWGLSWWLAGTEFHVAGKEAPLQIKSQLTATSMASFLSGMVPEYTGFKPLGIVLVVLMGVGIAEHAGFIGACLKSLLLITPQSLLTPMLLAVALISHSAADAGFVLLVPIGGVMFYAAGRHPLGGIAVAFAGVAGGFSANFIVSSLDPLLAGLTQEAAALIDDEKSINPLCNYYFTASSTVLIVLVGWLITHWIVEPKLQNTIVDADARDMPSMTKLSSREIVSMTLAIVSVLVLTVGIVWWAWPIDSALRVNGSLTSSKPMAPMMDAIVPFSFIAFALPGLVYGYASGKFKSHRDVIQGMSKAIETMGYYLVLVLFAALFIAAFNSSNIGLWLAVQGATALRDSGAPLPVIIVGIVVLSAVADLLIGSASAKWALLAPIFVPMLMMLGVSPEFTQAAYRIGDSTTNIITPMMPYFPLVVVFCQKYVKNTGIGTVVSMMLPYSVSFFFVWTIYLVIYWQLGLPLGPGVDYEYTIESTIKS